MQISLFCKRNFYILIITLIYVRAENRTDNPSFLFLLVIVFVISIEIVNTGHILISISRAGSDHFKNRYSLRSDIILFYRVEALIFN